MSASQDAITKKVTISCEDLGEDATLFFILDDPKAERVDDAKQSYPVVWKVASFHKEGQYATELEYTNILSFVKPDIAALKFRYPEDGEKKSSDSSTWRQIAPGTIIVLERAQDGENFLLSTREDKSGSSSKMVLQNMSGYKVDVALGFQKRPKTLPQFIRVYRNVGADRYVNETDFKPVVRAFVASGYEEGDILLEPIQQPSVWTQNLDELSPETYWELKYDAATGKFRIVQIG